MHLMVMLFRSNVMEIPYQIWCCSFMQCVRGNVPNFDVVSLLKGGLEEIISSKVIDESHTWNLELTCLDRCDNDPLLYNVGNSGMWTHGMDDVFPIQMMYANESGKLMLYHPPLFEMKS